LGDSFYEYLLKVWLLTKKTAPNLARMYEESANGIEKHMVKISSPSNLTYLVELSSNTPPFNDINKMDHLACFTGGMFALGAKSIPRLSSHFNIGARITATCHEFYARQRTGISPELVHFLNNKDDFVVPGDASHYILRPETVESFFYMYRFTGNKTYQDWGWDVYVAINKSCRVENGWVGIRDVTNINSAKDDLMQSFFLAETLKYLYLLYTPNDFIDLDKYVFNTEAHPFTIFEPSLEMQKIIVGS